MCFEGLARLSRRVWRRFVRGSREISLVPSLHRASTDALIIYGLLVQFYYVLALVEDFLFRILWIFNLSVGNHVLRLVNNDIIATVAGVLEIVRWVSCTLFVHDTQTFRGLGYFGSMAPSSEGQVQ